MKNIIELFPECFEIAPDELTWYESKGFIDIEERERAVYVSTHNMRKCARDFAINTIIDSENLPEIVELTEDWFITGARWYIDNYRILHLLSLPEYDKAVDIATSLFVKKDCMNVFLDEVWTEEDVYNLMRGIEEAFETGIEWAKKNKIVMVGVSSQKEINVTTLNPL